MEYLEVKIFTTTEGIDPVCGILLAAGIEGYEIQDKNDYRELFEKKHSYDWDYVDESLRQLEHIETNITAYLKKSPQGYAQLEQIRQEVARLATFDACGAFEDIVGLLGRLHISVRTVCDDQWKDTWKAYFKPEKVTDTIVIKPSWEAYESHDPRERVIQLDPGAAFGTGKHPTTVMCMRLLERCLSSERSRVMDVGCGSGILSIAAGLLGAREVLGIEIDPMAAEVARENVELNGLSEIVRIQTGDLTQGIQWKADVVVANIMADIIIRLSQDVPCHLLPEGYFIFSGVIEEKLEEVVQAVQQQGFSVLEVLCEEGWCAGLCALKEGDRS